MASQIIELKSRPPLKKSAFFLSNCNKIEVMITSLMEIAKVPNFGQMAASTIKICVTYLVTSWTQIVISLIQNSIF